LHSILTRDGRWNQLPCNGCWFLSKPYFVIGGAGAPLYPLTDKPPSSVQKQAKKYHYAIFDVSGSKVTVKVIGYDDKTDKFAPIESAEL
jgi:hypothetical protein